MLVAGDHDILGLDISVRNPHRVQIANGFKDLAN